MSKGQGYKSAILVAESVAKQDYMDNYEVRVAEIERKKAERQADIKRVIHEYTTFVMTEFLSKENLEILHENIEYFAYGQSDLYKPIRSKVDNSLRSIDLMHFVWNIGERLGISLIDRATFIHTIFPHELKDASIKYLAKNLRTCGVCKIALDIPKAEDRHGPGIDQDKAGSVIDKSHRAEQAVYGKHRQDSRKRIEQHKALQNRSATGKPPP